MQATEPHAPVEQRPLGEVLAQMSRDSAHLVQQEIALAKEELREKANEVTRSATSLALGGAMCLVAALALTASAIIALAHVLPAWLAAFLVAAALAAVGAVMLQKGKKGLKEIDPVPRETAESVGRDVKAIKEAVQ